jgi:hypothetical protein
MESYPGIADPSVQLGNGIRMSPEERRRKPAFTVAIGETVTSPDGLVLTTRAGQAEIGEDVDVSALDFRFPKDRRTLHLQAKDVVYLLTRGGEGSYTAWFKGTIFYLSAQDYGDLLEEPIWQWWVQIRNSKGKWGWTDRTEDFSGFDGCG